MVSGLVVTVVTTSAAETGRSAREEAITPVELGRLRPTLNRAPDRPSSG
jgi:hypothetical protein